MAAQEYYMGTQGVHELPGNQLHTSYAQQPPPPQQTPQYQQSPAQPYPRPQYNTPTYSNTPPPAYSAIHQPPVQKPQPQIHPLPTQYPVEKPQYQYQYPTKPPQTKAPPYPQTPPPAAYYAPPPQQKNGYLGAPLQPVRSHSQPARVRFADQETDKSTQLGETSSSDSSDDSSPRRRRRHRHYRDDSDYSDRERERHRERERERERERRHRHKHKHYSNHKECRTQDKEHKNRDTFLGAGAGTLIGDALFPGLGTAAGLILGGYGGRKYAERSQSEDPRVYRRRKDSYDSSDGEYRRRNRR